jgi:competence protein ComEA
MLRLRTPLVAALCSLTAWVALAGTEVNTASEAELDSVKGLGPGTTARILKARESAPFADWADFMKRVKGIRPATAAKLSQAGLTVNDTAFKTASSLESQK